MIIDGHTHATGIFADPDRLVPLLDSLGVDKVVLCPGALKEESLPNVPKISYTSISKMKRLIFLGNRWILKQNVPDIFFEKGNERIFSLRNKCPERILQYFWVNPSNPDSIHKIQNAIKSWKINGIKLHQCLSEFSNDSPQMHEITKIAGDNNLPIFIHVFSVKEVKKLVSLAREFPDTNFTLAHLIGLEIAQRYGKDLNNLYFDISTYYIISERRIRYAIKHFGADHVLLGSDSPFGEKNLENNIKKIKEMKLKNEEKELILGKNIQRLLNL
jgi:predicted TIM-barrel fold metal-dependent hydrolase